MGESILPEIDYLDFVNDEELFHEESESDSDEE